MSINFPKRRNTLRNSLALCKAIKDAKNKLGSAYFESSLLECSKSAVELTKLVNQWGKLEKEKVKTVRGITREQDVMLRSLKARRTGIHGTDDVASREGIETLDGKMVAPGFRFKSNGDIKQSTHVLPVVNVDDDEDDEDDHDDHDDTNMGKASKTLCIKESSRHMKRSQTSFTKIKRNNTEYVSIDYEKEIRELENVILTINTELSKSQANGANLHVRNSNTFLKPRASESCSFNKLHNRFAFKPGSNSKSEYYVYKQTLTTPSNRDVKTSISTDGCQRKWNYSTNTKYTQFSRPLALMSTTSLAKHSSASKINTLFVNTPRAQSMDHFEVEKEILPERAISMTNRPTSRCASSSSPREPGCRSGNMVSPDKIPDRVTFSPDKMVRNTDDGMVRNTDDGMVRNTDDVRGLRSSLSMSSARLTSQLLNIDYEARMEMMRSRQAEEQQNCARKVSSFLQKLDSHK